jgi:beta-N-acetylhexosaminidase
VSEKPTLSQAIGRLISTRLPSTELETNVERLLKDGLVGGVVAFKENASSIEQLVGLLTAIQKASFHTPILSIDQEGGAVQRLDHIVSPLPSAMALSAINEDGPVTAIAKTCAKQLKLLGFNCCLSPVLDVVCNPLNAVISTRSYGSEPDQVTRFAGLASKAFLHEGIVPVGKHFPGHGSTKEDSHLAIAVNEEDPETLWRNGLNPFRNCLAVLPAILVGHIWLKSIDPEQLPASLSAKVINGILRSYLNYDGLVMTDDMMMRAITDNQSLEEASLKALQAGVDHLLLCSDFSQTNAVHAFLLKAVEAGRLKEEKIQLSLLRTEKLFGRKVSDCENAPTYRIEALKKSIAESNSLVLSTSIDAITTLRGAVPSISSGEWLVIIPKHERYPLHLVDHLRRQADKTNDDKKEETRLRFLEIRYSLNPSEAEMNSIASRCAERRCIFVTFRSALNQGQYDLGNAIAEVARERVHVACDSPYDLVGLKAWENCLATFDPSELAMEAVATVLLGIKSGRGVCPVDLHLPFSTTSTV